MRFISDESTSTFNEILASIAVTIMFYNPEIPGSNLRQSVFHSFWHDLV